MSILWFIFRLFFFFRNLVDFINVRGLFPLLRKHVILQMYQEVDGEISYACDKEEILTVGSNFLECGDIMDNLIENLMLFYIFFLYHIFGCLFDGIHILFSLSLFLLLVRLVLYLF